MPILVPKERTRFRARYEKPGLGDLDEDDVWAQHDMDLARRMAEVLNYHYPGHLWATAVESRHRLCYVSIPVITHNWKYVIKMRDLAGDPGMKAVVKAGGEILERWKIPRGRIDLAAFVKAQRLHGINTRPPA